MLSTVTMLTDAPFSISCFNCKVLPWDAASCRAVRSAQKPHTHTHTQAQQQRDRPLTSSIMRKPSNHGSSTGWNKSILSVSISVMAKCPLLIYEQGQYLDYYRNNDVFLASFIMFSTYVH